MNDKLCKTHAEKAMFASECRASHLQSMHVFSLLTNVPETFLSKKIQAQRVRSVKARCFVISSQYKAVKLVKWDPQGFDGLEVGPFVPSSMHDMHH